MEAGIFAAEMTVPQRQMVAYCLVAWDHPGDVGTIAYRDGKVRTEFSRENGGIVTVFQPEEHGDRPVFRAHFDELRAITSADDMSGQTVVRISFDYGPRKPCRDMTWEQARLLSICKKAARLRERSEYEIEGVMIDALPLYFRRQSSEENLYHVLLLLREPGRRLCTLVFSGGKAARFTDEIWGENFSL